MYDSLFCCQAKTARRLPLWSGRCQGRRTLAFILTLDTDPTTPQLAWVRISDVLSEIRTITGNRSFIAIEPDCRLNVRLRDAAIVG